MVTSQVGGPRRRHARCWLSGAVAAPLSVKNVSGSVADAGRICIDQVYYRQRLRSVDKKLSVIRNRMSGAPKFAITRREILTYLPMVYWTFEDEVSRGSRNAESANVVTKMSIHDVANR